MAKIVGLMAMAAAGLAGLIIGATIVLLVIGLTQSQVEASIEAAEPVTETAPDAHSKPQIDAEEVKGTKGAQKQVKAPERFQTFLFTVQVTTTMPEAAETAETRLRKMCGAVKQVKDIDDIVPVSLHGVFLDEDSKPVCVKIDL